MNVRPTDHVLPPPAVPTEADRKAVRAFWRGVFCGAVGLGILGGFAGWLS